MLIHHPVFTHAQRLERWLGAPLVEQMSASMRGWYGAGLPVGNAPGRVYVMPGGEFRGPIRAGRFGSLLEYQRDRLQSASRRFARSQLSTANAGFASWSDLINEATSNGKLQPTMFTKVLPAQAIAAAHSAWQSGPQPAAGAAGSAAPGGRACTSATIGALPFVNAGAGDTMHYVSAQGVFNSGNAALLLLYDRIFDVAKTMSSTATEAVTGVPSRYQSTTGSAADYAGNNFLFPEVQTTLGATAHNWTVCKYTSQAGTAGQSAPSMAGISAGAANRLDVPLGQWFMPLASGDTGVKALTQMQCDASVTGAINFVIGHPIAMMPLPANLLSFAFDGIGTAFNPMRVFDDACLAFLNIVPSSVTAPTISGLINLCAG
jgi:hypothetical protein